MESSRTRPVRAPFLSEYNDFGAAHAVDGVHRASQHKKQKLLFSSNNE